MKNFGFAGYDNVVSPGTNGKMTDISAVMGLTGLESIDEFIAINRENYNYQFVTVEVNAQIAGLSRDELIAVLHAENVLARRYFYPGCHNMEPYRTCYPNAHLLLPNTIALAAKVLALPTGNAVGAAQIGVICQILKTALGNPIATRLALSGKT